MLKEFGPLESAIMNTLWDANEPLTGRKIRENLNYERNPAYTTVMTVVDILVGKGYLTRVRPGRRAWLYSPVESREMHHARQILETLRSGGDAELTMTLVTALLSADERAALHRAMAATGRRTA